MAGAFEPGVAARTVGIGAVPSDVMILDIGPEMVTSIAAASRKHAPSSGTGRSALSRRRPSIAVRWPWRRRSASSPAPGNCSASPAAATRLRPSPPPGSRRSCPTSRRQAVRSSNGWKVASYLGQRACCDCSRSISFELAPGGDRRRKEERDGPIAMPCCRSLGGRLMAPQSGSGLQTASLHKRWASVPALFRAGSRQRQPRTYRCRRARVFARVTTAGRGDDPLGCCLHPRRSWSNSFF